MSREPHRHFHDELARLKERVLAMSGKAEEAVTRSVEAFLARDEAAALAVMHGDDAINRLEVEIADTVTSLLARHQPVARDLRLVLAALKISNDLERVGDHAVNIAQSARSLATGEQVDPEYELVEMTRCVREMLSSALTAFVNGDADLGRKVCRSDDQVDALHQAVFKKWISKMSAQPGLIDPAMEILRVSRNLERVADLATNVAEDVVFLVEGIMIAHHADEA